MAIRYLLTPLLITTTLLAPAWARPDEPTVVVFSRHTFRGVEMPIGPHRLGLGRFQLDFNVPLLGYAMEATDHGLAMARQFGAPALQEAATLAVHSLGRDWDGHWDEMRADLSAGRDFFTALAFRSALQPAQTGPILLTGCPTREGKGVDIITIGTPVRQCIPAAELKRLREESPNRPRRRQAAEELLRVVGKAMGRSGPFHLEDDSLCPEVGHLAGAIEMAADEPHPLQRLFPQAITPQTAALEPEAVQRASNYLGSNFIAVIPLQLAQACSLLPLEYVNSMPPGHNVVALTHDDDLSSLLRSLELIQDDGEANQLAMFPMESVVFALDSQQVAIVRMSMKIGADGSFPGSFTSRLLWQGSRPQWEQKIARLRQACQAWPAGARQRAQLRILPAPPLDVLYQLP